MTRISYSAPSKSMISASGNAAFSLLYMTAGKVSLPASAILPIRSAAAISRK